MADKKGKIAGAIEWVKTSMLKFFEGNPKKFQSKTFSRLLKSIKEVGILEPITVNTTTKTVLNGNQRLKVAMQLGIETVPVQWVTYSKEDEAKILIHLNKTLAEQDEDSMLSLIQKYPDDAFIRELMTDYALSAQKTMKQMSPEYDIVREVDESYDYLVFITKRGVDWLNIKTFFNLAPAYDANKQKLVGEGRVIDANKLSKLIDFVSTNGVKNVDEL